MFLNHIVHSPQYTLIFNCIIADSVLSFDTAFGVFVSVEFQSVVVLIHIRFEIC